jgi:uncharacterized protein YdiU (UPF0061 family)
LLSKALIGDTQSIRKLFNNSRRFDGWIMVWQERISQEGVAEEKIASSMDKVNPMYIPRNHKVEEALEASVFNNDMKPFNKLYSILQNPYHEIVGLESFAEPAPESNIPFRTFCGT